MQRLRNFFHLICKIYDTKSEKGNRTSKLEEDGKSNFGVQKDMYQISVD